jgi:creatinine amidohydrolase
VTAFFAYEDLTWQEVAELPRDTPLVLPFYGTLEIGGGDGQRTPSENAVDHLTRGQSREMHAWLAHRLGQSSRAGILPALPYGWKGSGIEVPSRIQASLCSNLLDGLAEDGFETLFVLAPEGVGLELGRRLITLPGMAPAAGPAALPSDGAGDKVVLVTAGHTEQHGYHLPLNTDTLIIDAIGKGVQKAIPEGVVCLPVMPYGVSTHRKSFAGTMNAGGRIFEVFFLTVVDELVRKGFQKVYLLSGHGGNCSFFTNAVKYAGERHPETFIATSWLYLSGPLGIASLEAHRQSAMGGMGHAGELETSLMLHLRPDLVRFDRVVDEVDFIATPSYYMDWVEGGALVANPPWEDDTRTGAYGAGSLGTPEKGETWLRDAIAEKVSHVGEIEEQWRRRRIRREQNRSLVS